MAFRFVKRAHVILVFEESHGVTHRVAVDARLNYEWSKAPVSQLILNLFLNVIAHSIYNLGILAGIETNLALFGILRAFGCVPFGHDSLDVGSLFSQLIHLIDVLGDLFLLSFGRLLDITVSSDIGVEL